jgi:hypothetical protein
VEIWGYDESTGVVRQAVIRQCLRALYHNSAGDLNNNGIPEVVLQCAHGLPIEVWEYRAGQYEQIGAVTPPQNFDSSKGMLIDDMECNGDVNRDGVNDCVFCGNSSTSHVLTFRDTYLIDYSGPRTFDPNDFPSMENSSFTQTCSIGDIDNDGYADWFDSSQKGGLRVFSYRDGSYGKIWDFPDHGFNPPIGSSFVGDPDNDGLNEFLVTRFGPNVDPTLRATIELWEGDGVGTTNFRKAFTWPGFSATNMIVGNLNPYNDHEQD